MNHTRRKRFAFVLMMVVMLLLSPLPVSVADTDFLAPTTYDASSGWANPQNGLVSDDLYATADSNNKVVSYAGFTFAIPADVTIDGIEVSLEGYTDANKRQAEVSLTWNNGISYTSDVKVTAFTATDAAHSLGGATDQWGTAHTWLASDFAGAPNLTFRVRLVSRSGAPSTVYLDQVRVKIYYSLYTTTTVSVANGTYGGTADLTAALSPAVAGKSISFALNGEAKGSALTNASGIATLNAVSLTTGGVRINAGTYATGIGASFAGDATYTASSGTGSLTVDARPVNVTANSGQTKVYGDADPVFTYTANPLLGSDTFTGALGRTAGEDVGSYAINQGTLSAGANYTITFVSADFGITPKPITVTADAKTKVYGSVDPVLTYTSTDSAAPFTGALGRTAGEDVGTYAINQGTLSAGANYAITFVGANLAITPANTATSLTSSANPSAFGAAVTFTARVTPSSATGDVQFYADGSPLGSAVKLSAGAANVSTASLLIGRHLITATYSGDANHTGSTSAPLAQRIGYVIYLPVTIRNAP